MLLYHIAKILEICGFLLITIFVGILLNPEIVGRFAHRIEGKLRDISLRLVSWYMSLAKPMMFMAKFEGMLGAIMLRGVAVGCIIGGCIVDISWLFWLGVALATPYAILGAIVAFLRLVSRLGLRWVWLYPAFLSWALILAFIIAPPVVFIYWLLLLLYLIFTIPASTLVLRDATKKGLVILGSILVISGLIVETIATW